MAGYADPELAGRLGVDPNTSFVDDVAKGDVTYFTRADGNAWTLEQIAADRDGFIADSKIHRIKRDQVKPPPPTAPVPHPPEFIPDSAEALAVCTTPDVCKVGDKPVPFQVYGKGSDDQNYAPNVFSNGQRLKLSNSVMTTTHGDEPGVNKGVKSGTVGDVVEPVTSSDVVFVNGNPAQRHGDECTLNNGNCPGEYVHVQSTAVDQAPDGRDAADKAEDTRNSAKKAFDGFYDNSSEAQAVGAGLKRLGDYTGDPTLIGQDLQSAWNSVPTADEALEFGENVAAGAGRTAEYVWNNPGEAASGVWNWGVDGLSGLWTGVTDAYDKGGVAQAGGHLAAVAVGAVNPFKKAKLAGRAAEGLEDLGDAAKAERLAREAREAEEGARKARDAERATEDGSPGARSTRKESENPCHPLVRGNGSGPYRGGAHMGTRLPIKDGLDSHHMPADSVTDLPRSWGPAIQMLPRDHWLTGSNGRKGLEAELFRDELQDLIDQGRWRDALAKDIRDARSVARAADDPTRYNEAIREMLAYNKCLEQHGIVPGKGGR